MSLTPDYIISGSGIPKLNREKYKLLRENTEKFKQNKKLLSKRTKSSITDKDIKSAINQKIKLMEQTTIENSNNSNDILDNRLNYKKKYSNEIFGYNNQTDMLLDEIVLPPLEI